MQETNFKRILSINKHMDKSHFIINPILKFGSQKKKNRKTKLKVLCCLWLQGRKLNTNPATKHFNLQVAHSQDTLLQRTWGKIFIIYLYKIKK